MEFSKQLEMLDENMETVKKYTWQLVRDMERCTKNYKGTFGKLARFAEMILPHEWNDATLPAKRGPSSVVPTYILPVPLVLSKGPLPLSSRSLSPCRSP